MDIDQFFEEQKKFTHNASSKQIPSEFLNWRADVETCKNFFEWIRRDSSTGSLKLDITTDIGPIVEEINQRQHLGMAHRSSISRGWRGIVLHGLSSIMTEATHVYKDRGIVPEDAKESWTDVSIYFPRTVKWVTDHIPLSNYSRIRIMILDPGGYILPHQDYPTHLLGGGINIGLTNPPGVEFAIEGHGLIPWADGDIRMINIGHMHSVRNLGTEPRIHILAYPNQWEWKQEHMEVVCRSYEKHMI